MRKKRRERYQFTSELKVSGYHVETDVIDVPLDVIRVLTREFDETREQKELLIDTTLRRPATTEVETVVRTGSRGVYQRTPSSFEDERLDTLFYKFRTMLLHRFPLYDLGELAVVEAGLQISGYPLLQTDGMVGATVILVLTGGATLGSPRNTEQVRVTQGDLLVCDNVSPFKLNPTSECLLFLKCVLNR